MAPEKKKVAIPERDRVAKKKAQEILGKHMKGAVAVLASETNLPKLGEGAALEMHVFDVPEGENRQCMQLLLRGLRPLYEEEDFFLILPHSVLATQEYYPEIVENCGMPCSQCGERISCCGCDLCPASGGG